jgi:hypothetical protein
MRVEKRYPVKVDDLIEFPCVVALPILYRDDGWKAYGTPIWEEIRDDDAIDTDLKFQLLWARFNEARRMATYRAEKEDWDTMTRNMKLQILEYQQIGREIEERIRELLNEWFTCHKSMNPEENTAMFQALENRLTQMVEQEMRMFRQRNPQTVAEYMDIRKRMREWQAFGQKLTCWGSD